MKGGRRRVWIFAGTDFLLFYAILLLVAFTYRYVGGDYSMSIYIGMWPFALSLVGCNAIIRLYHGNFLYPGAALSMVEELRRSFFSITLACLVLLAYLSISRTIPNYSRVVIALTYILAMLFLPLGRWVAKTLMKRSQELLKDRQLGLLPIGFLDDNPDALNDKNSPLPILGNMNEAVSIGEKNNIEYLILCLPLSAVKHIIPKLTVHFKHILIVPSSMAGYGGCIYSFDLSGFAAIELKNQLLLKTPRLIKGFMEICMATTAVLLLWPLGIVLAILIKLGSNGPIFYRATRLGIGGKAISIMKFRTMYTDADERLEQVLASDPAKQKEWNEKFKITDDPRITPLGKFLRRTSLDELPQFMDVLTGKLAVIGPRPITEKELKYYGDDYELISRVKPGITGLWQVSGRSTTSYETRVFLDRYYIMNWSPWLDYYIFLKTIKEVLSCRGAQ